MARAGESEAEASRLQPRDRVRRAPPHPFQNSQGQRVLMQGAGLGQRGCVGPVERLLGQPQRRLPVGRPAGTAAAAGEGAAAGAAAAVQLAVVPRRSVVGRTCLVCDQRPPRVGVRREAQAPLLCRSPCNVVANSAQHPPKPAQGGRTGQGRAQLVAGDTAGWQTTPFASCAESEYREFCLVPPADAGFALLAPFGRPSPPPRRLGSCASVCLQEGFRGRATVQAVRLLWRDWRAAL